MGSGVFVGIEFKYYKITLIKHGIKFWICFEIWNFQSMICNVSESSLEVEIIVRHATKVQWWENIKQVRKQKPQRDSHQMKNKKWKKQEYMNTYYKQQDKCKEKKSTFWDSNRAPQ